jgi:hypothetical protein
MNRERVAHRFIAPDVKLAGHVHLYEFVELCGCKMGDEVAAVENPGPALRKPS